MTKLARVAAATFNKPWYIIEEQLDAIADVVRLHMDGGHLSEDEIRERLASAQEAAGPRGGARTEGSVGVIPIYGTIFPRANLMTSFSGGATVDGIRSSLRAALGDESIGSILFEIDSPGGYADGIEELATEIREARGRKPMAAIARYTMASASYYLGCQADEVIASPSAQVGWVGTVMVHQEFSKMLELEGVTTTIFRDPPGKYGGNQFEPISEKAAAEWQQAVTDSSAQFHTAVSKARGISVAKVRSDYGQGGGMSAARAKVAGLVDRVETIDATIRRLATGRTVSRGTSAAAERASADVAELAAAMVAATGASIREDLADQARDLVARGPSAEQLDDAIAEIEADPLNALVANAALEELRAARAAIEPDRTTEAAAALALARARAR